MKSTLALLFAAILAASASDEPNIVVILTDDQGYADISFNPHHPREVDTPHMDSLAREGVFFSQAYTSGNVCSPTRAGLMLGRYQQRAGVYDGGTGGSGFDPKIPIFPAFLPDTYVTGAFGKWHLGLDNDYPELKWHPLSRGFDSFYGFMGRGAHDYYNLRSDVGGKFMHPIYRDKQRIHDKGYLTTRLTEEAVDFIHKRHEEPFLLYVAYNAVHAPAQAPDADIKKYRSKYPNLSEKRATLMAMLEYLDNGIGDVVKALKETNTFNDTLLFFFTDNGGAGAMEANNAPLRGRKSQVYEGGHRTPFIVSWPDRFKGGRTIDTPIISLDVLPTALDALGQLKPDNTFDGKSLLPMIEGKSKTHHDNLFWSEGGSTGEWAVRSGDFKLLAFKDKRELYNLADDPAEAKNLIEHHPAKAREMEELYHHWLEQMAPPADGHPKRWSKQQSATKPKSKKRAQRSNKAASDLIDFSDDRNVAAHRPIIIAHRGGVVSPKSHECSLTAIRLAAEAGYDMVELDIQRSRDGIPILFHDRTLTQACGKGGRVADHEATELESIRYLIGDDHIIRLESALKACHHLGLGVMLDLKAGRDSAEFLKRIDQLIVKHKLGNSTNSISGTETARQVLKHVRFTPTKEEMDRLRNGETLDLRHRFWFGLPKQLQPGDVDRLKSAEALILPAINTFRYPKKEYLQLAKDDIERLTKQGVDGFQIDSIYFESFNEVKKPAAVDRKDTFTPYHKPSDVPQNVTDLWKDYDARKEALDVRVVKEWKSEGVVTHYITFTVGTFKGAKSRIAAYYSFPNNGKRNAAFVWSQGGGQRAERNRGVYFAKQGFATIDINWLGRPMEEGIDLNTDWGKVDPTQGPRFYTKALRKGWKRNLQPDDYSIDPIVSPRNANWFLLTVAARRAITFLERQPEVAADKIGFSGYSMGGMVTALTAIDPRLKAVVPMVGGTGFKYVDFPGGIQGSSIRVHFKDDLELYQNTIDASGYWPLVNCPVLFLSSSNDFHSTFERIYESMDLLEHPNWRVSTNIHQNHGPGPEQWVLLNKWFDQHLKGIEQDIPVTPPSTFIVDGNQARFTVTPEDQDRLIGTEIYYSYDPNSRTRFWNRADAVQSGKSWETSLTVHAKLPLYAFALCHYHLPEKVALQRGETSSFALNSLEHSIIPETVDLQLLRQLKKSRPVFEDFKNGMQDWSSRDGRTIKTYKFQSPDLDVSNTRKLRLTINPKGKSLSVRLNVESKFLGSGNDQGSFSFVKQVEGDAIQEIVIDREAFKPKNTDKAATLEWSKIATFEVTILDTATQTKLNLTSKQGHEILKRIDLADTP